MSSVLVLRGTPRYEPWEFGAAVVVACAIHLGAVVAFYYSKLDSQSSAPQIEKGSDVSVKVTPVLDLDSPLLKLGGKKQKYKLPDQWVVQTPKKRVKRKTYASTKAEKDADSAPPDDVEMADAGEEADPDADLIKDPSEVDVDSDAGPSNTDDEGHQDGVAGGTETDPLKARAVDLYRMRIAGFFTSKFRVSGSGIPQDQLVKLGVPATVQLSGLTVTGFSMGSSGNAAVDAAARNALQGSVGQQIPPPPENYPDISQNQISLTFVCREGRCD